MDASQVVNLSGLGQLRVWITNNSALYREDLKVKWAKIGYLAATLAGSVYIVEVNATGGDSYPTSDGADDKVPPPRRAR